MECLHENREDLSHYGEVTLQQCQQCKLVFSNKFDSTTWSKDIYQEYYRNEISAGRFRFGLELIVRLFRLFRAYKVYTLVSGATSILDIGSGRGLMLYY